MSRSNFHRFIGLSGVAEDENLRAIKLGKILEIPMILLAIWIVIVWYTDIKHLLPRRYLTVTDLIIWIFFILETGLLTYTVNNKFRYLRGNWLNLLIIAMGIPILWGAPSYVTALRTLRLFLIATLFLHISDTIRQVLSKNNLGITLLVGFFFILASGMLIAGLDPGIDTVWEGIWWAWVTVTTVGYGDIVPSSHVGRMFAALLILIGIGLFSLLTANFSAFFISKDEQRDQATNKMIMQKLNRLERKLDQLEQQLHNKSDHSE